MTPSKQNQKQRDDMVAGIVNEIRGNASVNYRIAKFEAGQLVYNRNTDEDGFISCVVPDGGVISYEVWIPKEFNTWNAGHWISRWYERDVTPSGNKRLGPPNKT
jgi:hypothetical protein